MVFKESVGGFRLLPRYSWGLHFSGMLRSLCW